MKLTVYLWSRKKGELKNFLERYFDKGINMDVDRDEWSHVYGRPVEAVDIISAVMDNSDKYRISVCIQLDEGQMHMITADNHNEIIKDIFHLFYNESDICYN